MSLLFLGNDSPAPGTLIKLDHGKKKVRDGSPPVLRSVVHSAALAPGDAQSARARKDGLIAERQPLGSGGRYDVPSLCICCRLDPTAKIFVLIAPRPP